MQKINILLLLTVSFWSFVSCGKEENPSADLPEWGKNNTVLIQAYSRFNNQKLFNTNDYSAVINQIRSNQNYVVLLHRVDASLALAEAQNPTVTVAAETERIPLFAWTRYANMDIEGSGILVGQTIVEMKNTPISNGCRYVFVPLTVSGTMSIDFASITLENETQLTAGITTIKEKLNDKTVLLGFAAKTLQNKLKVEFSEESYRFETMDHSGGNVSQFLFLLTSSKWKLHEYKETTVGIDGISCFDLKIENL